MNEKFSKRGGMGARPHVSEAKLTLLEDACIAKALFAGDLHALNRSSSRHEKQMAIWQVVA